MEEIEYVRKVTGSEDYATLCNSCKWPFCTHMHNYVMCQFPPPRLHPRIFGQFGDWTMTEGESLAQEGQSEWERQSKGILGMWRKIPEVPGFRHHQTPGVLATRAGLGMWLVGCGLDNEHNTSEKRVFWSWKLLMAICSLYLAGDRSRG